MVLAHSDDAPAWCVDDQVRVAHITFRADWLGHLTRILPVQALVVEVGEPDGAAADCIVAAAIFMDARAGIEAARCDVGDRAIRGSAHDDLPAVLFRPALDLDSVDACSPRCTLPHLSL